MPASGGHVLLTAHGAHFPCSAFAGCFLLCADSDLPGLGKPFPPSSPSQVSPPPGRLLCFSVGLNPLEHSAQVFVRAPSPTPSSPALSSVLGALCVSRDTCCGAGRDRCFAGRPAGQTSRPSLSPAGPFGGSCTLRPVRLLFCPLMVEAEGGSSQAFLFPLRSVGRTLPPGGGQSCGD